MEAQHVEVKRMRSPLGRDMHTVYLVKVGASPALQLNEKELNILVDLLSIVRDFEDVRLLES